MPIYEYQCRHCGVKFEKIQSVNDPPVKRCPECRGRVYRVIQPVGIIFKGSGFYVTDNRRPSGSSDKTAKKIEGGKGAKSEKEQSKDSVKSSDD